MGDGVDAHGAEVTVEGTGLLARCRLQHECDHLDGMLFIDRLPAKTRKKLLRPTQNAPTSDFVSPRPPAAG